MSGVSFDVSLKAGPFESLDLTMIKVEVNTGRASATAMSASASKTMMAALGISAMRFWSRVTGE